MGENNMMDDLDFMGETIISLFNKKKQYYSSIVKQSNDEASKTKTKILDLNKGIKDYEDETSKYMDFTPIQKSAIESITDEIKKISVESDEKLPKITEVGENVHIIEKNNQESSSKISTRQFEVNRKLENIQKHIKFYEEYLGIVVEKFDSYLRFIFTCIDHSDVDRQFSFSLTVGEVYDVFEVSPEIEDLDSLIKELNISNNLKQFLCKIRKSFKHSISKLNW